LLESEESAPAPVAMDSRPQLYEEVLLYTLTSSKYRDGRLLVELKRWQMSRTMKSCCLELLSTLSSPYLGMIFVYIYGHCKLSCWAYQFCFQPTVLPAGRFYGRITQIKSRATGENCDQMLADLHRKSRKGAKLFKDCFPPLIFCNYR
jgi:hypothetical protein